MSRDPRYDILFEPVKIGPVTAKNRFYQVPHCNGMGHQYPSSMAEMRGVKAEGGWAVVCTEEVEISPTSEHSPLVEGRLWDDRDIPVLERMTDKIHEHGGLAGIQPCYLGFNAPNHYSREIPMAPSITPVGGYAPIQARAMNKADIKAVRQYYIDAALRSKRAGFDIIYNYAAHNESIQMHFLSRRYNQRSDEYGGSLENRVRLFREIMSDMKDAVGDKCAIAVRFGVDELLGSDGISCDAEGRDIVEMLADIPDLWDVNVSPWENDSLTSRFGETGSQEPYTAFVKQVTGKPVVGVGRYTSPDKMVSLIKGGKLDLIGAARPSIADPFLPNKIDENRLEDIRECIGCNICVTADFTSTPFRCTQNPTQGEEWRRGWHPEKIAPKKSDDSVLIVGAGPAGLEAAQALGKRGYQVILAEATTELGGRVVNECRLPGLSEWIRVRDYREAQIHKLPNVEIYLDNRLTAEQILEFEFQHVVLANGSKWANDGCGRANLTAIEGAPGTHIYTPDDIMAGAKPSGKIVIFDDDHYYMGGLLAEKLRDEGHEVSLVTPAADVSNWTHLTLEQERIQTRLLEMGVVIRPHRNLTQVGVGEAEIACTYTDRRETIAADSIVLVTMRYPEADLYQQLIEDQSALDAAGIKSVTQIGDTLSPGTIAAAVWSGHRYARELDEPESKAVPFKRELPGQLLS
ncbi:MAG: dimethylamine/trimethylamine dehydrogenase [Gammaproteobacteria bacterium]|jgi:dimethylamine/trimethylamine dehydrogenase